MEFRLYNKPNCSLFDLIGNKEPDQTKGFGLILSESRDAMKAVLGINKLQQTFPRGITSRKLLNCRWIVDCEFEIESNNDKADIIIKFFKNNTPIYAVAIEAKTINGKINPLYAASQLSKYIKKSNSLSSFNNNLSMVIITNADLPNNEQQCFVTWKEIIDKLERVQQNNSDSNLIVKYLDYITKINGCMKHYTHEVMSIPAGMTYDLIKDNSIYICTVNGKHYKARAQERPLYVGCRQRGGKITELYKIKEIIQLNLSNNKGSFLCKSDEDYLKTIEEDLPARINQWCNDHRSQPIKEGANYVFVFERDYLNLPKEGIIDKGRGGKGTQNHTYPKLAKVFEKSLLAAPANTLSQEDYDN